MREYRILVFCCFLLVHNFLLSQENQPLAGLNTRAEACFYSIPGTPYFAKARRKEALKVNSEAYIADSARLHCVFYQRKAMSGFALIPFEKPISIYIDAQNPVGRSSVVVAAGMMAMNRRRYSEALDRFLYGQSIDERSNNEVLRSKAFLERDRIYSTKGEYRKALREMQYYYNKVKDSEVLSELAAALNYVTGKFMLLNMNVSSLIYLQKNLEVQRQQGYPIGIGSVLENIATVYKNQLSLAFGYLENASEYYKSQNYSLGLAQLSINRSEIFFIQKREKKVIQMLTGAVVYSSEKEDYYSLRAQYDALAAAYDLAGNTNGASRAPKNLHAINDGLISIVKQRAISEPLAKYETKEKKQQLALQKAQLGVQELKIGQNRLLIIGLVLIALLLIVVMLLVRQLSKKKEQLLFQKAQLKLREAELNAVINAQEKERHRFARELHNGFGQLISVLKLNLSMLTEKDAQYPEKRMEVFKNGESVINDMYAELRSICFDLMPQTLIKKGLTLALKEFGDRINQSKKMSCEVIVFSNQERLSEIIEISLFRISQEWVNNILKYSESEYITIHLTRDEGAITLTIENDGKGFDSQQFFESKGNGWRNIQTRLNLIKGGFDLDTHPEREGTMITVNVSNEAQKRIPTSTVRQIRG